MTELSCAIDENGTILGFIIEQDGETVRYEADNIAEFINHVNSLFGDETCNCGHEHDDDPQNIEEWYQEWRKNINEITDKEKDLIALKETYAQMEQKIIDETDFKELYGKNNEAVRKNHVKNELKDMVDERHDLELRISYLKRRIDFIKSLMSIQKTLIEYGVME